MPKQSGPALAADISKRRPEIKVLFMSGYTEGMINQHGLSEAPEHFIGKPFTMSALRSKVREVLATEKPRSSGVQPRAKSA